MSAFFRWFLVVVALTTLVTLTQLWIRGEARTAATMLDSARERWRDLDPDEGDFDGALRELELALGLARQEGDREIEREILLERVRVHLYRESYDLALEESDHLLTDFDGDDPEVLLLAADSALGAGKPETTIFYADHLLEVAPDDPDIVIRIGQAEAQLADLALSQLDDRLEQELADEPARLAADAARRAAAHPPGTLLRHAALEDLYSHLSSPALDREALESVDLASKHLLAASQAFVARLRYAADGQAVSGLQAILLRSGAVEEAADLGRLALEMRRLSSRTTVLIRTAMALDTLDRGDQAKSLIEEVQRTLRSGTIAPRTLSDDELYDWCLLLYRLELWDELMTSAQLLSNREVKRQRDEPDAADGDPRAAMSEFFMGVAQTHLNQARGARRHLKNYQDAQTREAFPGVQLQTWLANAETARRLGRGPQERFALIQATKSLEDDIDDPALANIAGEAWFRLGEFQLSENDVMRAERSLAHAVRLLPRRRDEVEGRWKEAGEAAIAARSNNRFLGVVNPKVAPYQTCMRARSRVEEDSLDDAVFIVERVLDNYPGLPLALEIEADAEFRRQHYDHAIDALLELAEKGFYEPQELELLDEIPFEEFSGGQLIRWMLFDPRSAGLVSVARELERSGRTSLALQTLRAYSPKDMDSGELAFFARLLANAGEWDRCGQLLQHIPPEDPLTASVAVLAVRAALETDPRGSAGAILPLVLQMYTPSIDPQDPELAATIDLMLTRGEVGAARTILETVDARTSAPAPPLEEPVAVAEPVPGAEPVPDAEPTIEGDLAAEPPPAAPSREVLIRLAIVHTILHDDAEAAEALERAEPFFEGDEASIGWLVRAADARDFEQLLAIASELYDGPFNSNDLRRALLTTIENPAAGLRQLRDLRGHDDDPRRIFALEVAEHWIPGATDEPDAAEADEETGIEPAPAEDELARPEVAADDGRFLLPLVLALESRPWSAWTLDRLAHVPAELADGPAARLLEAYAEIELGDLDRADEKLVALLAEHPDQRTAWLLREDIAEAREADADRRSAPVARIEDDAERGARLRESQTFLELRLQRLDAIGPLDTPPREIALARAFEARRADRPEEARSILETALSDEPDDFALRRELARLLSVPGNRVAALDEYNRLFNVDTPRTAEVLPEVLALLRSARRDGEISDGVWWAELEALESQFPAEPAVARELAERTIASAAEDRLDWGVEQAWDHLDRFRQRTRYVPVESLRPGEAEAWSELYRRYDPDRAVDFAYAELTANPMSPDLWRAWCEGLAAAGRREEAVRAYKAILAVVPEPGLLKSFALLQADRFDDPSAIRAALGGVELFLDRHTTDPDLVFRRGLSLLGGTQAGKRRGLRDMNAVWQARQTNGIDRASIGRRYAITLHHEGYEMLAQNVLREAYLEERDPLQIDVLRAVAHLIHLAAGGANAELPPPAGDEASPAGDDESASLGAAARDDRLAGK